MLPDWPLPRDPVSVTMEPVVFQAMQHRPVAGMNEARPLNGHLLLVRPGSLLGNSIDLRPGARVIPQEAAKICSTQQEHPAIAERHDVGPARPPAQQRHLAKKVAAPHTHALV